MGAIPRMVIWNAESGREETEGLMSKAIIQTRPQN